MTSIKDVPDFYDFQEKACSLIRKQLPRDKELIGFVGSPWTLYTYAVEGIHRGALQDSKCGLYDGRWHKFCEIIIPSLEREISAQLHGGADILCFFDTAVGELTFSDYCQFIIPVLHKVAGIVKELNSNVPVIYYSKYTHLHYLQALECDNIDVLGIDWRINLSSALNKLGENYYIQGNLDPSYLCCPWEILQTKLHELFVNLQNSRANMDKWIMGLGHGVLPTTPQENVKKAVEYIHKHFLY